MIFIYIYIPNFYSPDVDTEAAVGTGLVGYWGFDEGSGTVAADSSGNGNTGTLINGPIWTTGKIGQALDFDGTDDYVNAGSGASLDNITVKTVSMWLRRGIITNSQALVNKGSPSSPAGTGGWMIEIRRSTSGGGLGTNIYWYKYPAWTKFQIGSIGGDDDLQVGDINNDGILDVVVNGGTYWYENPRGSSGNVQGLWTRHTIDAA